MKRVTRAIILLVVLALLALWSPWLDWDLNLDIFDVTRQSSTAALQVTSLAGELEVFVGDSQQPLGMVNPENSPLLLPAINPGVHQVRLVRQSEVPGAYWEYNELIEFQSGADVILAYELGPTAEFSEGHVIYTLGEVASLDDKVRINITSDVTDVEIYLDDTSIGTSTVNDLDLDLTKQYKIALDANGYERQEFIILPENEDDRRKLAGLELSVYGDLFLQPIKVINE